MSEPAATPAEPPPEEANDPMQRIVAVLIIVVTLLGAVVAFLQTQAGNRESSADRAAQSASVDTMASLVESNRRFGLQAFGADTSADLTWLGYHYVLNVNGPSGDTDPYTLARSRAFSAAAEKLTGYTSLLFGKKYSGAKGKFDLSRFFEDQYEVGYRAGEFRKAYERERGGWGSKGNRFITVITVYAVALFLLGLTLTVPGGARKPFLWMGCAVATAATAWGAFVWVGSVEQPSRAAIHAYARGQAHIDIVESIGPPKRADYEAVVADMTSAIEARETYHEAHITRGSAHFRLDFMNPRGPHGSQAARDDWERAIRLDPSDYVGWGNLGAAEFWLGNYDEAGQATERALALQPRNPIFNLNRALFHTVVGERDAYGEQLRRTRGVLASVPGWLRQASVARFDQVFDLGIRWRPPIAPKLRAMREDVLRLSHEIDASLRTTGSPSPKPVATKVGALRFELLPDRTQVKVHFDYSAMPPRARWLYDTYADGERKANFSFGPARWRFATPSGGLVLTFTDNAGFKAGTRLRTEIFVEGNVLSTGEYTVPAP